jgi:DNA-binding NarL/FixJ family response regulator
MSTSILIVDDHEKVRRALRKLLEVKFSQYQVIEASSGEEAVTLTLAEEPQLIIMDITLPGMSGIESTRRIRATSSSPPVVMFTIHEDDIYRQEAEDAGAIAYVAKHALQSELLPMGCAHGVYLDVSLVIDIILMRFSNAH